MNKIFFILLSLFCFNVQADALTDATLYCENIQAEYPPITCKTVTIDDGTPVFMFLISAEEGISKLPLIITKAILPVCEEIQVGIILALVKEKRNVSKGFGSWCSPTKSLTAFKPLD